jgi:hypothetical protein
MTMITSVGIGALFILIDALVLAFPIAIKVGDALWKRKHSVLLSSVVAIAIFVAITTLPVFIFGLFEGVIK